MLLGRLLSLPLTSQRRLSHFHGYPSAERSNPTMPLRKERRRLQTNSLEEAVRFATSTYRHREADGSEEGGVESEGDPAFSFSATSLGAVDGISLEDARGFEEEAIDAKGEVLLRVTLKSFSRTRRGSVGGEPLPEPKEVEETRDKEVEGNSFIHNLTDLHKHVMKCFEENLKNPKAKKPKKLSKALSVIHVEATAPKIARDPKLQLKGKRTFFSTESAFVHSYE
ncbi:hypothetical protein QR680_008919 [Steinernema hermaphroditum]|uniref:Uncharacterized protein n=1 Tax=Steinernema hermaphroditum TaxID=289476 RepID=A0AA39M8R9_9BILA|nr:hypothetical protein QR680_008919 [Steinernema hermaphroditum]